MRQSLIPTPPGPGVLPEVPERPVPVRATPPPAGTLWYELEEVRRRVEDLAGQVKAIEDRLARLEGPKH